MPRRFVPSLVTALLLCAVAGHAENPKDLVGQWALNPGLSHDVEAKIKEAAGSQYMSGTTTADTWIPWGGTKFDEGRRVAVREFLLASVPALLNLTVEVSPAEVKTIHGEAGVRIFNLTRSSAGTSALTGETLARQARWQGQQIVLESKGKDGRLTEVITPVPTRKQITYVLRFEAKLLEKPLEVSLVYDQAPPSER